MPTEFASDGIDFEDLFDPDIVGDGPQATWLENLGAPLRFAALAYGTKRADVGYDDGGVDVSNLWAAKGTAAYNPKSVTAASVGGAVTNPASIRVRIFTNGTISYTVTGTNTANGNGTFNYVPTVAGASAPYDFRISGSGFAIKSTGTAGTLTGKGGVNHSVVVTPGAPYSFDTGWITTADDTNPFLLYTTGAGKNQGASQYDGSFTIQVRRKSDGVVVRTFTTNISCTSDGQA